MKKADIFKAKFDILQELSDAIVITDDFTAIASLLLDLALNYAYAEKGSLMLLTERDELRILAARGLDPQLIRSYRVKIGEGIAGMVAKNPTPVLVEDIEKDDNFKSFRRDHYKTKSFISCPIISKNKLLGIININDKRDGTPFSVDEFELLKVLANNAAIALENAFLLAQLKSKAEELEDINKKLVETDILKTEFLTRISHELRTPLNSVKGAIYFLQQTENISKEDNQEFQGIISTETDKLISLVENLLNFLRLEDEARIIKKTALNLRDIFKELLDAKSLKTILSRRGINLTLDTQDNVLDIIGDKIKVIQLFTSLFDGLSYHLERGDSIQVVATETGCVNVNILLPRALPENVVPVLHDRRYIFQVEHPEDRLKLYLAKNIAETHRWNLLAQNAANSCRITLRIPKRAKETIDTYVDRSMDSFVEFISELLDLDICSIMLGDELTSELTVKSAIGLDDDIVKRTRIKFGDKIAGWVALEGKPLFIEDIENDPRFAKKSISQYTTKSLMSLPLKIGDRVIGVLNLNNKKTSQPFTKRDYSLASILSEKIAQFIELLSSDNYREDDLKKFIASLDTLFTAENADRSKKDLLPDLIDKILRNARPLKTIKTIRTSSD
ncbi:MAG TPA: GAF domain-containing protein [Nitrospirota bacterium]|nr:GAF domain-containing protein [Nitrospirota bacterium]